MTNDSHLFPPRPQWEAKGYRPDEYSRWLLGDWRPIKELWEELGADPSQPEPVGVELEDWLFDMTAGPERREAEARFVHGHWLKPGDVARTEWRMRCARPPYDGWPVARGSIPAGVVLSRDGDAWGARGKGKARGFAVFRRSDDRPVRFRTERLGERQGTRRHLARDPLESQADRTSVSDGRGELHSGRPPENSTEDCSHGHHFLD